MILVIADIYLLRKLSSIYSSVGNIAAHKDSIGPQKTNQQSRLFQKHTPSCFNKYDDISLITFSVPNCNPGFYIGLNII